jgi:FXSXX-COOH protein
MPAEPHDNDPAPDAPDAPDVLALDLESLRTVDHPVLSALVDDLRERAAAPGTQALWGFDNAM